MDGEVHVDPSSISLFSTVSVDEHTQSSFADEDAHRPSSSTSLAFHHTAEEGAEGEGEKDGKFSAYKRKKNMELIQRRNLVERLDKLKDQHGITFTIPQFKTATNSQLSIFLRRLRKHSDIRQYLSMDLLQKIFTMEDLEEREEFGRGLKPMGRQIGIEKQQQMVGDRAGGGIQWTMMETKLKGEEDTDEEYTDYEDDDIFGSPDNNLCVEMYDLLEKDMQILAADAQALKIQAEIRRKRRIAEKILAELEEQEQQFLFEALADTGDPENDSMTSARCRPLLDTPQNRTLIWHDFDSERKAHSDFRPLGPNRRCGTEEYSFADGSLHPKLSLPSSIPLDAQILKYLHAIDVVPGEVELRRFKTSQLVLRHDGDARAADGAPTQSPPFAFYYNLEDEFRDDTADDKLGPSDSHGIKLSLPLMGKKTLLNKRRQSSNNHTFRGRDRHRESSTDSDPNDVDYEEEEEAAGSTSGKGGPSKFKRRRMTYSSAADRSAGTSKASKLETRRTSHAADLGSTMFDYNSHVMDIGLPLPTIQKVENVEIVIPSFRKKSALLAPELAISPSTASQCGRCPVGSPWDEIRRLHADLESQEKRRIVGGDSVRFRSMLGSSASRKSTMTSSNNPLME